MLTLVVTSLDGQPVAADLRGKFGLLGGTIGAMEGTTMTLPDCRLEDQERCGTPPSQKICYI